MPPNTRRNERTVAGAIGGTTTPTTRRAAAAAKQSSINSHATTTAAGKRATSSSKQKGTNVAGATSTNTTAPSNQIKGISATAAIAAAIGATTAALTKQKGVSQQIAMIQVGQKGCPLEWLVTHQNIFHTRWLKKSPRHAAAETLVVLNDGVQPSDDVDDVAKEIFDDDKSPRHAAAETLVVLNVSDLLMM
jgi:hypothetical protein